MLGQKGQEAPRHDLASEASCFKDTSVIILDVGEVPFDDPADTLVSDNWSNKVASKCYIHKRSNDSCMMTSIGERPDKRS